MDDHPHPAWQVTVPASSRCTDWHAQGGACRKRMGLVRFSHIGLAAVPLLPWRFFLKVYVRSDMIMGIAVPLRSIVRLLLFLLPDYVQQTLWLFWVNDREPFLLGSLAQSGIRTEEVVKLLLTFEPERSRKLQSIERPQRKDRSCAGQKTNGLPLMH